MSALKWPFSTMCYCESISNVEMAPYKSVVDFVILLLMSREKVAVNSSGIFSWALIMSIQYDERPGKMHNLLKNAYF